MSGFHKEKLASLVRDEVSLMIARNLDVDGALVTVTDVELSPAGESALIGVSVIPSSQKAAALAALEFHRRDFQHSLIKRLKMRHVPSIRFCLDEGLSASAAVEKHFLNK